MSRKARHMFTAYSGTSLKTLESAAGMTKGQSNRRLTLLGLCFMLPTEKAAENVVREWWGVFRCECGTVCVLQVKGVSRGITASCGCYRREVWNGVVTKHGLSSHPLYDIWASIKQRCTNPASTSWINYGGRGISMCDDWRKSFEKFYEWSMGNGYSQGLDVDRKDNNGPYCPDNCRWVTRTVNMRNTRRNHHVSAFGETKTIAEWAEDTRCVCTTDALWARIKAGYPSELSITGTKSELIRHRKVEVKSDADC